MALQLVLPAWMEIAGDRQEPAADALGARAGVPDVLDRRRVCTPQPYGGALARGDLPRPDRALGVLNGVLAIGHRWSPSPRLAARGGSWPGGPRRLLPCAVRAFRAPVPWPVRPGAGPRTGENAAATHRPRAGVPRPLRTAGGRRRPGRSRTRFLAGPADAETPP